MATKISSIYTLITVDDKPLKRGLVSARKTAVSGAKRIQTALNKINFRAVALGATAMAASLGFATKKFIDLAVEQERVEKRLGQVLKSTGNAAGFNLAQMKAMASAMQQVTTTGDEVILSGMAMLSTFKQIRGEAFKRAQMAALDLSEVMQQDLRSSIVMVGKALNDPIANLGALGRAGIQFTKQQKEVVKTLWTTGRVAEAQNIILKEMESQFGGTARAARDTFGGALKALGNTTGDIGEKIGFALIPPLLETVKEFDAWITKNDELLNQDVPKYVNKVATAVKNLAFITGKMIKLYDELPDGVTGSAGIGIVGRILFGSWAPAKLAIAFTVINDLMKNWGMDVRSTIQDFKDLSSAMNTLLGISSKEPTIFRGKVPSGQVDRASQLAAAAKAAEKVALESEAKVAASAAISHDAMTAHEANRFRQSKVLQDDAVLHSEKTHDAMLAHEANRFRQSKVLQRDSIKNNVKTFDTLIQLSERTAAAMQRNFSDLFFDIMDQKFTSLRDYANAMLTSIKRALADVAGQQLTSSIFGALPTITGGGQADIVAQHGAYIGERVRGFGASGKSYEFHPNEVIQPVNKMGSGVNVDVNVTNNLGQEAQVDQSSSWVSPDRIVADIVLNKKLTSRGFRQGLRA